jgi:protein involved in polysaccharide export with SLBB domain
MEYGEIERLIPPDLHPVVMPFQLSKVLDRDPAQNLILMQFDTIRLFRWDEKAKQSVSISGMVYEPNEYRFIPGMRLTELIDAAGGLKKNTYVKNAEITRQRITQDGLSTLTIDVDLEKAMAGDPNSNVLLQDYDRLVVRPIPELELDKNVKISGQVRFPGMYPIRKRERLSSLLERAGGFTDRAYLKGAVFTRESAKTVQQKRMDDMVRQLEQTMLSSGSQSISGSLDSETAEMQKLSLESRKDLLTKLKAAKVDGRVVIRLESIDQFRSSKYDLDLEDGDELVVPDVPGVVYVVGEVFNPSALLYESGKTVGYYLARVGGVTKEADGKQLYVVRADGSVASIAQRGSQQIAWDGDNHHWRFGSFMSIPMDPGDTIVVPRKLDRIPWIKTTKDLTQIVFQIAVAAGVVLAI